MRGAIEHQSIRGFFNDYRVGRRIFVHVERYSAIGLGERSDKELSIRDGVNRVLIRKSRRVEFGNLILQLLVFGRCKHVGHIEIVHLISYKQIIHKVHVVAVAVREHKIFDGIVLYISVEIVKRFLLISAGIVVVGAVYHHIFSVRKLDINAISLPHVKHMHKQFPVTAHERFERISTLILVFIK